MITTIRIRIPCPPKHSFEKMKFSKCDEQTLVIVFLINEILNYRMRWFFVGLTLAGAISCFCGRLAGKSASGQRAN
jgi:hypothetical protein